MPDPKTLTCPTCGAPLNYDGRSTTIRCTFCQNVVVIETPKLDMEQRSWLDTPVRIPLPVEIPDLLREGKKVQAIRRYREVYDVSLARAMYAIEQIEAGNVDHPESGFQEPRVEKPRPKPVRKRWPWSRG